jgi:uncharacterized protein (DUF433 family)
MTAIEIHHLEITPDICGGKPHISGTRLSVHFLARFVNNPDWTAETLADAYGLSPAQVYAAWSYYYDNKDEIDDELRHEDMEINALPNFRDEMGKR